VQGGGGGKEKDARWGSGNPLASLDLTIPISAGRKKRKEGPYLLCLSCVKKKKRRRGARVQPRASTTREAATRSPDWVVGKKKNASWYGVERGERGEGEEIGTRAGCRTVRVARWALALRKGGGDWARRGTSAEKKK